MHHVFHHLFSLISDRNHFKALNGLMPKNIVTKLLVCLDHQSKGYLLSYKTSNNTGISKRLAILCLKSLFLRNGSFNKKQWQQSTFLNVQPLNDDGMMEVCWNYCVDPHLLPLKLKNLKRARCKIFCRKQNKKINIFSLKKLLCILPEIGGHGISFTNTTHLLNSKIVNTNQSRER